MASSQAPKNEQTLPAITTPSAYEDIGSSSDSDVPSEKISWKAKKLPAWAAAIKQDDRRAQPWKDHDSVCSASGKGVSKVDGAFCPWW